MKEEDIITEYVHPPIPCRHYDWQAWVDGREEDGPKGWGRTEQEAVNDLKILIDDWAE